MLFILVWLIHVVLLVYVACLVFTVSYACLVHLGFLCYPHFQQPDPSLFDSPGLSEAWLIWSTWFC